MCVFVCTCATAYGEGFDEVDVANFAICNMWLDLQKEPSMHNYKYLEIQFLKYSIHGISKMYRAAGVQFFTNLVIYISVDQLFNV